MALDVPAGVPLCRLAEATGTAQPCRREACAFWEPGGAVLLGRCAFERLDLMAKPELAAMLLELRRTLETARTSAEELELRRRLSRLLSEDEELDG